MEKIRLIIVEDELIIAEDLSDILVANNYEVAAIAKNYHDALKKINDHLPDIILLDIKIKGELDGINLAQTIKEEFQIPFIFISSHSDPQTVKRAAEVNPYGYIIKPFEDNDVLVSIEVALSNFAKEKSNSLNNFVLNDCLFVREKNLAIKIPMESILFIKAEGNYSTIQTKERGYVLRSTLKDIESKLSSKLFYRSHKSYIINLKHLTAINSDSIYLNDNRLPIGRGQLHQLMNSINKI